MALVHEFSRIIVLLTSFGWGKYSFHFQMRRGGCQAYVGTYDGRPVFPPCLLLILGYWKVAFSAAAAEVLKWRENIYI